MMHCMHFDLHLFSICISVQHLHVFFISCMCASFVSSRRLRFATCGDDNDPVESADGTSMLESALPVGIVIANVGAMMNTSMLHQLAHT